MNRTFLAFFILIIPIAAAAEEKIVIDMAEAPEFQSPVAIATFQDTSEKKGQVEVGLIEGIIAFDLLLSGFFHIIDKQAFLVDTEAEGYTKEKIRFTNWQTINAIYLIKGWYKYDGLKIRIAAYLFDVIGKKLIEKKLYEGQMVNLRRIVHRFSDRVIELVTGQKGICESKIALVARMDKAEKGVYVMDYDGFNLRKISRKNAIHLSPSWDRSGMSVAYITLNKMNWEIWIADLSGKTIKYRQVPTKGKTVASCAFSPTDPLLAVSMATKNDQEIFLMDIDGSKKPKQLTSSWNIDVSPAFSPEGRKLVYTSAVTGQRHIYSVNIDGSFPKRLTYNGRNNETPSWSPKGDLIAFAGMDDDGIFDIFTIRSDGSDMKRLTWDSKNNESPCWSPDGRYIMFSSTRDIDVDGRKVSGRYHIFMMKANGKNQSLITKYIQGDYTDPEWSVLPNQ